MRDVAIVTDPTIAPIHSVQSTFPTFTTQDHSDLCLNRYGRFVGNRSTVAWALTKDTEQTNAIQFPLPISTERTERVGETPSPFLAYTIVPEVTFLTNNLALREAPNREKHIVGKRGNELFRSERSYHLAIQHYSEPEVSYTFHPCSPTSENKPIFFPEPVKRFADTNEAKAAVNSIPQVKKTGRGLQLNKADILERDKVTSRNPDQNKTMGLSAVTEFSNVAAKYDEILTDETRQLLEDSAQAELSSSIHGQKRTEWLHGESYRHTPMTGNPQRRDNLGAARKCHNTEMMILEGVAKWFALHVPGANVSTDFDFHMLLDTDVIDHIYFYAIIHYADYRIRLMQDIDPLTKYPCYVKTSDLSGLIHILCMLLQNVRPASQLAFHSFIPRNLSNPPQRITLFVAKKTAREDYADPDEASEKKTRLEK